MKVLSAERPEAASSWRTEGWGRFAAAYALDLSVSLLLVLATARIWAVIAGTMPDNPWADQLQQAVTRFTPLGLWEVYSDQLRTAVAESAINSGSSIAYNMLFGLRVVWDVLFAAVQTLGTIWQQTETVSDWLSLLGFIGILAVSAVVLATGAGRLSLGRLLLAVVAGPLSAVGLFWLAQQTALDALNGFSCYAMAAPWCLLCPVACTLYWVIFPGAEHGATACAIEAFGRLRLPHRQPRRSTANAPTVPLRRKQG